MNHLKTCFILLAVISVASPKEFFEGWMYDSNHRRLGVYHGYLNDDGAAQGFGFYNTDWHFQFTGAEQADLYSGMFKDGNREGLGQYYAYDKSYTYRGEVDRAPNGFGVEFQSKKDGSTDYYIGNFKEGKHHGKGWLFNSRSGQVQAGTFQEDEFISGQNAIVQNYSRAATLAPYAFLREVKQNGDKWYLTYQNGRIEGEGISILKGSEYFWGYFKQENGKPVPYGKGVWQTDDFLHIGVWGQGYQPGLRFYYKTNVAVSGEWSGYSEVRNSEEYKVDYQQYVETEKTLLEQSYWEWMLLIAASKTLK